MKKSTNEGYGTFNASAVVCAATPVANVTFKVTGVTSSRYYREEEAARRHEELQRKLRKAERKPTDVGICRLQEAELHALWAWEDAHEDHEILLESFQALIDEGHEVRGDVFQDTFVDDMAKSLVNNLIPSIVNGVSEKHLPWKIDEGKEGLSAEKALQKAIGNAYGNIKGSKALDKDVKGLILRELQGYRGGSRRTRMNKSYKAYCTSHKIDWKSGEPQV